MLFGLFGPKVPAVTVDDLHRMLASGEKLYLLDVRTQGEFDQAHLPPTNALIPYDILERFLDRLPADKDSPVYCVCRSGRRSAHSTLLLRSAGYANAFNVTGGIVAWVKAGYTTSSESNPGGDQGVPEDFFSLA